MAIATNRRVGSNRNLIAIAVLTGIAVMTKLNVGLLLVASMTLALSMTASNHRLRLSLTSVSAFLIVAGVFVVTRSTFGEERGLWLPTLVLAR